MKANPDSGFLRVLLDFLDVALVAGLIYGALKALRGSKAVYMLLGLAVGLLVFWLATFSGLYTLSWLLSHLFSSLLLITVVVFQNDIRRVLTRMGMTPVLPTAGSPQDSRIIEEIVKATVTMANKKIGALIVLEKEASVLEYLEIGVRMDSLISRELLLSIFHPSSPIHDGAVVVQKGRILAAGCFLPMTGSSPLGVEVGTRHRAAISITEETDVVVVIVSEEKGWISFATNGHLTYGMDGAALRRLLVEHFQPQALSFKRVWKQMRNLSVFNPS